VIEKGSLGTSVTDTNAAIDLIFFPAAPDNAYPGSAVSLRAGATVTGLQSDIKKGETGRYTGDDVDARTVRLLATLPAQPPLSTLARGLLARWSR
jgi:hypothetical protein